MKNDVLDAQKQHKVEEIPIRNSFALIRSLRKKLHEIEENNRYLLRKNGNLERKAHRAERGTNLFEAENLALTNKKLRKENEALLARIVFLLKQGHTLKSEISDLRLEVGKNG